MTSNDNQAVAIENLAGDLTNQQTLVAVELTEHEARVLAAHQRESALRGIHEAGHVVVAAVLGVRIKSADISIRHSGVTDLGWNDETEVGYLTGTRMDDLVAVSLAGLEAEQHFLGEATNGGSGDLADATSRCLEMVAAGMDAAVAVSFKSFGAYQGLPHPYWLVDQIAQAVDERMRRSRKRAAELVANNAERVVDFARLLVAAPNRRLSDDRLAAALHAIGIDPPPTPHPVGGMRRTRRRRRR